LSLDELRRIGGEQEIIARYEPERAVETLPVLVADRKDRNRLLRLLERVLADPRVQRIRPTAEQKAMLARIRGVLGAMERRPVGSRRPSRQNPGKVGVRLAKPRVAMSKKSSGAA